jgi:copper chaperone CopZ
MGKRHLMAIGALATILSVTGVGASSGLAQEQHPAGDAALLAPAATAQVTFHVPTMMCAGCQYRVEGSISKAPGILDIAFGGQDVTVTYDPSVVTPEAIAAAIEAGGDTVEPVGA